MPSITKDEILRAVAEVMGELPFPDYTCGVPETMLHLIPRLWPSLSSGGRLLDIGCGQMDKTAVFQKLGLDCHALDDLTDEWHSWGNNQERILQFAEQQGIRFHLGETGESVPFEEGSFDVVTLFDIIEHLHESPRGILNVAGRFLKPEGTLCVTMPNSVNLRKRLSVLRGKTSYPPVEQFYLTPRAWRGHVREYTLDEAAYIVRETGFEILDAATFEPMANKKLGPVTRHVFLAVGQAFPNFRSGLCVIGRKPKAWLPASCNEPAYLKAVSRFQTLAESKTSAFQIAAGGSGLQDDACHADFRAPLSAAQGVRP
jgi:SAM-dependent methyltransferase